MGSPNAAPDSAPEPGEWALLIGNQLKHLRATLAGQTGTERSRALESHLRRALQSVRRDRRAACLAALAQQFPKLRLPKYPPLPEEKKVEQTNEQVIEAFLRLVPTLPAQERDNVRQRLETLGLLGSGNGGLDGEALSEMQTKLKLAASERVDPRRLSKLFISLMEAMLMLDHLVWSFWRTVAPKSAVRRDMPSSELRLLMRRSVTGDAEASAAQVHKQIEATRQLIAGLLAAIGASGRSFARRYRDQYTPDAVRGAVKAEGGLFANSDARLWKKYTELAENITEDSIETDVQTAMITYTEELIQGTKR